MWNVYADLFKGNINLSVRVFFFLGGWGGITFTCVFCFVLFVFNCFFGRTIVTRDLLGMGWHENKQVRSGAVVGLFP